ncbi:MAG: UPF0280 family protein [Spirochaetes bacterium]|nr:UPF0280 family protein [Spirochaetota bacterium]
MSRRARTYRDFTGTGRWKSFAVKVETTDLYIRASSHLCAPALDSVRRIRECLWRHIEDHPEFLTSLTPLPEPEGAPAAASMMYGAASIAGVGPMAAVAGAIAQLVGLELAAHSGEIIVENGGDIWMRLTGPAEVTLFAGEFRFPGGIRILVRPEDTPCGICTSSARIGSSISFGKADAATVLAPDAALADALATECCNRVKWEEDIEPALDYAMDRGAHGVIVVYRDLMGIRGSIELTG